MRVVSAVAVWMLLFALRPVEWFMYPQGQLRSDVCDANATTVAIWLTYMYVANVATVVRWCPGHPQPPNPWQMRSMELDLSDVCCIVSMDEEEAMPHAAITPSNVPIFSLVAAHLHS
eukprot:scaffold427858_cov39-Prasinocladus_malaysianus.AAC.1